MILARIRGKFSKSSCKSNRRSSDSRYVPRQQYHRQSCLYNSNNGSRNINCVVNAAKHLQQQRQLNIFIASKQRTSSVLSLPFSTDSSTSRNRSSNNVSTATASHSAAKVTSMHEIHRRKVKEFAKQHPHTTIFDYNSPDWENFVSYWVRLRTKESIDVTITTILPKLLVPSANQQEPSQHTANSGNNPKMNRHMLHSIVHILDHYRIVCDVKNNATRTIIVPCTVYELWRLIQHTLHVYYSNDDDNVADSSNTTTDDNSHSVSSVSSNSSSSEVDAATKKSKSDLFDDDFLSNNSVSTTATATTTTTVNDAVRSTHDATKYHYMISRAYSMLLSAVHTEACTNNDEKNIQLVNEILNQYMNDVKKQANASISTQRVCTAAMLVLSKCGGMIQSGKLTEYILKTHIKPYPHEISYSIAMESYMYTLKRQRHSNTITEDEKTDAAMRIQQLCNDLVRQKRKHLALSQRQAVPSDQSVTDETTNDRILYSAASNCYQHVLQAMILADTSKASSNGADRARDLLNRMITNYYDTVIALKDPSTSTNDANNYNNNGFNDENSEDADDGTLLYPKVRPNRRCFSTVMNGYAQLGRRSEVEALLVQLQHLYTADDCNVAFEPDAYIFNIVLNSYCNATEDATTNGGQDTIRRQSVQQAEDILYRLYDAANKATVISDSGNPNNTLNEKPNYETTDSVRETVRPRTIANNRGNSDTTIPTLKKQLWPNTVSVNIVLTGWASLADSICPDAIDRALDILETTSNWSCLSLDEISYSIIMQALAESRRSDAGSKCEELIKTMWHRYDMHRQVTYGRMGSSEQAPPKPTFHMYKLAMKACEGPRPSSDAPICAERLYNDLLQRCRSGDITNSGGNNTKASLIKEPDRHVYSSLISLWSTSTLPESDIRVQLYFDQMRGKYMAGNEDLRPDRKAYFGLLNSKRQCHDGHGAESILHMMYDDCTNFNNVHVKLNTKLFHTAMLAWRDSLQPESSERIRVLMREMSAIAKRHGWHCEPNEASYIILIQCLSNLGRVDEIESVILGMDMLATTSSKRYSNIKPTVFVFDAAIQAWATLSGRDVRAPIRAQALYDEMIRRFYCTSGDDGLEFNNSTIIGSGAEKVVDDAPPARVFSYLLTAWSSSGHLESGKRCLEILDDMDKLFQQDQTRLGTDSSGIGDNNITAARQVNESTNKKRLQIRPRNPPNEMNYSAVLNAYGRLGDLGMVHTILERMVDMAGISPGRITFNTLINAFKNCDSGSEPSSSHDYAIQILRDMQHKFHILPDVVSYTTCMSAILASRTPDGYTKGKVLLLELIENYEAIAVTASIESHNVPTRAVSQTVADQNKSDDSQQTSKGKHDIVVSFLPNDRTLLVLLSLLRHNTSRNGPDFANEEIKYLKQIADQYKIPIKDDLRDAFQRIEDEL